jgi:hypothetical protein
MQDKASTEAKLIHLRTACFIWSSTLATLVVYLTIGHFWGEFARVSALSEATIIVLRTVAYLIALATFPLMGLLRRKMVTIAPRQRRQTAQTVIRVTDAARYTRTVALSLVLAESMSLWGVVLFILGDNSQTLDLFCGMSALAMVLYRPKASELGQLSSRSEP